MEFESTKIKVVEALKKNGSYDGLKAKLRASVFEALQGSLPSGNLERSQEGMQRFDVDREIVCMIQDFCKLKNLSQTSAILEAEWGSREDSIKISKPDLNTSYLSLLLKSYQEHKTTIGVTKARVVPPPPSAPKSNAPTAPLPQEPLEPQITGAKSEIEPTNARSELPVTTDASKQASKAATEFSVAKSLPVNPDSDTTHNLLIIDVDQAAASHKHERVDTPSVIQSFEPVKPPRQRYRSSDQSPATEIYINQANRDLLDADDDNTDEIFSSDRSAGEAKKEMENVDQFEAFSLEDITEGSEIAREKTLTKEDEEQAKLAEERSRVV